MFLISDCLCIDKINLWQLAGALLVVISVPGIGEVI